MLKGTTENLGKVMTWKILLWAFFDIFFERYRNIWEMVVSYETFTSYLSGVIVIEITQTALISFSFLV